MARKVKPVVEDGITRLQVDVSIPMMQNGEDRYRTHTIQLRRLNAEERTALRRIFDGLQLAGETLDGRLITRPELAIRWLLREAYGQWSEHDLD